MMLKIVVMAFVLAALARSVEAYRNRNLICREESTTFNALGFRYESTVKIERTAAPTDCDHRDTIRREGAKPDARAAVDPELFE